MKADFGADDGRIARFGLIDRGVVGPTRATKGTKGDAPGCTTSAVSHSCVPIQTQ
jgi:hypothetical protein